MAQTQAAQGESSQLDELVEFMHQYSRMLVLTGAGVSTDSGIPDYRDRQGGWKRKQPVMFQDFLKHSSTRQRYWARSMLGWPTIANAKPNSAHTALAKLQARGNLQGLVTQNVDGLHQAGGAQGVIDLHGRIDRCVCLACGALSHRQALQTRLLEANPDWASLNAQIAPDGDADLDAFDYKDFHVPSCSACDGQIKPDVVFFGESVPKNRVMGVFEHLSAADALLVVGSSLMVFSGYRFARMAARQGKPVIVVNLGQTRADHITTLKIQAACGPLLESLLVRLG